MPFLGMRTVGDLSEQELARIGREAIERTLRGPQGIPTSAQRDFAMQVYNQIAPQLTPESLSQFGSFVQPYFQATAGTRPTYATLQQARPLFLSQLEATGGDVEAISPWLRAVAQPLQNRSGLTASAALNERAWQQAMEGLGGWVRDPETGQLVPTAETQRAMALAYLASLGQQGNALGPFLTEILGWGGEAGPRAGAVTSTSAAGNQAQMPDIARGVLASGAGQGRIVQSAADAARRTTSGTPETPGIQQPSVLRQIAAQWGPAGPQSLAPSESARQQLMEAFPEGPEQALRAVREALAQVERDPNTAPELIQALRAMETWLRIESIGTIYQPWKAFTGGW